MEEAVIREIGYAREVDANDFMKSLLPPLPPSIESNLVSIASATPVIGRHSTVLKSLAADPENTIFAALAALLDDLVSA